MMTIWKFPVSRPNGIEIYMPKGARVLTAQMQNGTLCLWAVVDDIETPELRKFAIVGTGHQMPAVPTSYVSTFQVDGGSFVFHLFELA